MGTTKHKPAELKRKRERAAAVISVLQREYPEARCSLTFTNPLELLIATILSAQCTDEQVNKVTEKLFKKYPSLNAYAQAELSVLELDIRPTGFYRNKAKSIKRCCQSILERYAGRVPDTLKELVTLEGVGRKTANVVLGNAFGIPGMVVDTHVARISQRLGLTIATDPVKIEFELMEILAEEYWVQFSHQLIAHGRRICKARGPKHQLCPLRHLCPTGEAAIPLS
jgi:endonuclease-3